MTTPLNMIRMLQVLSQKSSLQGYIALAAMLHISEPQFNAIAAAIALTSALALVFMDDGTTTELSPPGK